MLRVGFVGFGEVAAVLSAAMAEKGAEVSATDLLLEREGGREILAARARVEGIRFRPLPELVRHADYVLSTVTTQAALAVARSCAPYLRRGQVFVDLNSTAPATKREMAAVIAARGRSGASMGADAAAASGASFVEGAILGAIGTGGAATRILLGGEAGREAAEALGRLGLNVCHYSDELGRASLFKMLRSILAKGLEALLLELLIAGRRAGLERELWEEAVGMVSRHPFERTAANWIETHAVACGRRYHEMVQVAETVRELGLEPVMTAATGAFFRRSLALGLDEAFKTKPEGMEAVVAYLEAGLREQGE